MRGSSFSFSFAALIIPSIHSTKTISEPMGSMINHPRIGITVPTTFTITASITSMIACFTWNFARLLFFIFSSTKYQMIPMSITYESIAQSFSFSTFAMGC